MTTNILPVLDRYLNYFREIEFNSNQIDELMAIGAGLPSSNSSDLKLLIYSAKIV